MEKLTKRNLYKELSDRGNRNSITEAKVEFILSQQDNYWILNDLINGDLEKHINQIAKRSGILTSINSTIKSIGLEDTKKDDDEEEFDNSEAFG